MPAVKQSGNNATRGKWAATARTHVPKPAGCDCTERKRECFCCHAFSNFTQLYCHVLSNVLEQGTLSADSNKAVAQLVEF